VRDKRPTLDLLIMPLDTVPFHVFLLIDCRVYIFQRCIYVLMIIEYPNMFESIFLLIVVNFM
jgi:hypothetical protein